MPTTQLLHLERYAPDTRALVAGAQALADERQHLEVEPIHLLYRGVERDPGVAEVFKRAGAEPADVIAECEAALRRMSKGGKGEAYLSTAFIEMLSRAEKEAERERLPNVGTEQLLNALAQEIRGGAGAALQALGLGPGALRTHLGALKTVPREAPTLTGTTAATSGDFVARATIDLIEQARQGVGDPVIGRDAEVRRVLQILERRWKNHPLLVGEPGVGKSAIVRALASRLARGDVPRNLAETRLLQLDLGGLVSGAKLRGEIEERMRALLVALRSTPNDVAKKSETILYIDDLASLFLGPAAGGGVGELLRNALTRGDLRVLSSLTPEGLRKIQDKDGGVLRRLTTLSIDAPDVERAKSMLRGTATQLEKHHGVRIGEGAVVAAVTLAKRYVQEPRGSATTTTS
jgi:ATP-dependent Clp protease ATP-binding subunit ClpB